MMAPMSTFARRAAALTVLVLAVLPASAAAVPPLPNGVKCTYKAPKTISAAKLLRDGAPVKVTCDGAASVGVGAEFDGERFDQFMATHYSGGYPGDALVARPTAVGAGTTTLVAKVRPWARGPARRYAPLTARVRLMTKRTDGNYWSPGGVRKTRVKR